MNDGKKRICVCFFGVIGRSIRFTYEKMVERMIDPLKEVYDVDVYVFNLDVGTTVVDGRPVSPSKMSRGDWCHLCGNLKKAEYRRKTTEQFVVEAKQKHGDKYDYSKVDYNNTHENVVIVCNSHGEFQQTPNSHLRGAGCPMCVNKTEAKMYETMKQIYPTLITQFKQDWCKRLLLLHLPSMVVLLIC